MKAIKKTLLAAGVALALGAGQAGALTINQILQPGINQISDNSGELLINGPLSTGLTTLDVSDRLRGVFGIDTITPPVGGTVSVLAGSGNNELAGIFDITVLSKTFVPAAGLFLYTFAPTPIATSGFGAFGAPAGTGVVFFEDTNHEFDRVAPNCTNGAPGGNCETNLSDGTAFWYAGFKAALGAGEVQFWSAQSSTDDVNVVGNGTGTGGFQLALFQLGGGTGPTLGPNLCVGGGSANFCGGGSLLATVGATPYDVFDDVNFTTNIVPEPGSLALLGLGLLGLGAIRRRA